MKNLFLALAFLFIGSVGFAYNTNPVSNEMYEDGATMGCYLTVTTQVYSPSTGGYVEQTQTFYLGQVEFNGFGAAVCKNRARAFLTLNF